MMGNKHEGNVYDHEGNIDVEATIEERRFSGNPVQYIAPGADKKWRARDLLDIHWKLMDIKCPESFNRIMSCIIGHANPNNGVCNPSQAVVAIETGYTDRTVRRAVDWWTEQAFLRTESRGIARSLAYHPQWDLFEMHWVAVTADIESQKETLRSPDKMSAAPDNDMSDDAGHYAVRLNLKDRISKKESHPKGAHPPSASDAPYFEGKEGAYRKETDVIPSAQPLPLKDCR